MNKIYKTVWNASLACVQVVSELAIGHQSSGGVAGTVQLGLQRFAFFNLALLPMMVWTAVNPDALPQGGNITQGSEQIQQQGNVLNHPFGIESYYGGQLMIEYVKAMH